MTVPKANETAMVRKRKRKKNYLLRIVIFVVLAICVYKLSMLAKTPVKTEVIRCGTLEDKINTDGYIVRRELVIPSPVDGVLSCVAGEGERVVKNAKVATVFEGRVDENLQSRITRINERISELERNEIKSNLVVGDAVQIDSVISKTVEDVIRAAYSEDMSKISRYKDDLTKVMAQRGKEKGTSEPSKKDELTEEKKRLEASAGADRIDIRTPIAGVFSSVIDGFESVFDVGDRTNITPDVIAEADKIKPFKKKSVVKDEGVVKIIDNYEWYYVAAVDARWVRELKKGSYVLLRFPEISGKLLGANIDSISEEKDGKVVLVISCNEYVSSIYSARRLNADILQRTYSGFKVPKSAVRISDDGVTGVYISKDGTAAFRQVDILHSSDEYVIVAENNNMENGLLLYDNVVVSEGSLSSGDIIR